MEKFYFEEPSIERKKDAINYILEFYKYNSNINGSGGLEKYLDNYENWLLLLEDYKNTIPSSSKVPARTYFLIRESDDKIIGMMNIRLSLNDKLRKSGGNIGYSIRPVERKKGYNKINLYLGLLICKKYGIENVLLTCDKENIGSKKTMEALGGKFIKYKKEKDYVELFYIFDVDDVIKNYKDIYDDTITVRIKKL